MCKALLAVLCAFLLISDGTSYSLAGSEANPEAELYSGAFSGAEAYDETGEYSGSVTDASTGYLAASSTTPAYFDSRNRIIQQMILSKTFEIAQAKNQMVNSLRLKAQAKAEVRATTLTFISAQRRVSAAAKALAQARYILQTQNYSARLASHVQKRARALATAKTQLVSSRKALQAAQSKARAIAHASANATALYQRLIREKAELERELWTQMGSNSAKATADVQTGAQAYSYAEAEDHAY